MTLRIEDRLGVVVLLLCLGLTLVGCGGGGTGPSAPAPTATTKPAPTATSVPAATSTSAPSGAQPQTEASSGELLFTQVCSACHGQDGKGVTGLGKNLVESKFVGALTDEQLLVYIRTGRAADDPLNTTGVAMPPSGARPDLSDEDMLSIIGYVRAINTEAGAQSAEAAQYLARMEPSATPTVKAVETTGPETIGDPEAGRPLFAEVCAPCHGQNASGIEGIGFNLTTSEFAGGLTDKQLADFIAMGRGLNSPFNFTGIRMPARGGRYDLDDAALLDIATYLKSINTKNGVESSDVAEYLAWLEAGGMEEIEAIPEVSSEGLSGPSLDGQTTFLRFCAVCHAPHGEGVESLGKSLIDSDFVAGLDDDGLIQFISTGRSAKDLLNTTGVEMLAYGGQESLSDAELSNLVAYLRVINVSSATVVARPSDVEEEEKKEEAGEKEHEASEEEAFAIIDGLAPKCFTCHRISERGNKNGPGPNLNGFGLWAGDRVPGMSARDYTRESILNPSAFIVTECPAGPCVDVMPKNFGEQLTEEQLETLISFLLSLDEEAD